MWHAVQYTRHTGRKMIAEYVIKPRQRKTSGPEEQYDAGQINAPYFFEYCFMLYYNTVY